MYLIVYFFFQISSLGSVTENMFFGVLKDVDDLMIRRFLRARDLDVDKASAMFLKYLKWRRESIPNGFISPSEIPNELAQNKLFVQGHDKAGRPIVLVFAARHKPASTTVEELKRKPLI